MLYFKDKLQACVLESENEPLLPGLLSRGNRQKEIMMFVYKAKLKSEYKVSTTNLCLSSEREAKDRKEKGEVQS